MYNVTSAVYPVSTEKLRRHYVNKTFALLYARIAQARDESWSEFSSERHWKALH